MTKPESQVAPPPSTGAIDLADWAEATLLSEGRSHLSRSALRRRLTNSTFVGQDELEVSLDLLLSEVSRRDLIAGAGYPFTESAVGLSLKAGIDVVPYEFLLWLSVSPHFRDDDRYAEIEPLFDYFVVACLIRYLGDRARGLRFAHPSRDGRPTGFIEAVRWLAGKLNLGVGAANPRPAVQDGGLDVVAWKPFADSRPGFVVILCQCTVAMDWVPKAKDIVVGKWNGWIDFGLAPLTALAIPFVVAPTFDRWDELRRTVNILFDRIRLCEWLEPGAFPEMEQVRRWTATERLLNV